MSSGVGFLFMYVFAFVLVLECESTCPRFRDDITNAAFEFFRFYGGGDILCTGLAC